MKNLLNTKVATLTLAGVIAASSAAVYAFDKHHSKSKYSELVNTAVMQSPEQIIDIVKQKTSGEILSLELEREDGKLVYEVEAILREENTELEFEIDASTGEILSERSDKLRKHEIKASDAYKTVKFDLMEAMAFAVNEQAGKVINAEFDTHHDKAMYEVEVLTANNAVYELEIDPNTGAIIGKELEDRDCD